MTARVVDVIAELKANPPPLPAARSPKPSQFLEWLLDDNFTFLGVRNYVLTPRTTRSSPCSRPGSAFCARATCGCCSGWNAAARHSRREIRAFLNEPTLLIVTKSAVRSRVHRRVYMDYVGVKRFDRGGKLVGEFRIVGLFTSTAYTRSTRRIPYLRRKVDAVLKRAGFDPDGHSGKALVNVLENYPRDELFQIDEDTLYQFALAVLQLDERPRVRVLPRRDRFDRFVSILVYVPRERYDSGVRKAIGDYLADVYKGRVSAFHPVLSRGSRWSASISSSRVTPGDAPNPDRSQPRTRASRRSCGPGPTSSATSWRAATIAARRARPVRALPRRLLAKAIARIYSPAVAVGDIRIIEGLSPRRPLGGRFSSSRRRSDSAASA